MRTQSYCRTSAIYPAMPRAITKFAKALKPLSQFCIAFFLHRRELHLNIRVHIFLFLRSLTPFISSSLNSPICVSDVRDTLLMKFNAFL